VLLKHCFCCSLGDQIHATEGPEDEEGEKTPDKGSPPEAEKATEEDGKDEEWEPEHIKLPLE